MPGQRVLNNWDNMIGKFVKVMPIDYKRALAEMAKAESKPPSANCRRSDKGGEERGNGQE